MVYIDLSFLSRFFRFLFGAENRKEQLKTSLYSVQLHAKYYFIEETLYTFVNMGGEVGAILGLVAALMYSWEVLVIKTFEIYSRDMYDIHSSYRVSQKKCTFKILRAMMGGWNFGPLWATLGHPSSL